MHVRLLTRLVHLTSRRLLQLDPAARIDVKMNVHEIAVTGYQKGEHYDDFRPTYTDEAISSIQKQLSEVNISADHGTEFDILELGAGTGIFTRKLLHVLPKSTRYIATEQSETFLNVLKEKSPGLPARQCAADSIPLADSSVKTVLCAQCFHWFSTNTALDEMRRVLTPGGKLVLVWNMRDVSVSWVNELEAILAEAAGDGAHILPTTFNWRKVFTGYRGFTNEVHTRLKGTPLKGNVESILRYYSTFSMISSLQEEEQKRTLQSMREIIQRNVTGVGNYPFNTEIFTYECVKD